MDGDARNQHVAAIDCFETVHGPKERALAGAGWSNDYDPLAWLHLVADASQDFDLTEVLVNIFELYGCNSVIEVERFDGRRHLEIMAQNLLTRPLHEAFAVPLMGENLNKQAPP
jgi:hypothetical protein